MALVASFIVTYAVYCDKLLTGLNVDKVTQKRAKSQKKRAKNGFSQNARLNGHACFKTGDFSTLG